MAKLSNEQIAHDMAMAMWKDEIRRRSLPIAGTTHTTAAQSVNVYKDLYSQFLEELEIEDGASK